MLPHVVCAGGDEQRYERVKEPFRCLVLIIKLCMGTKYNVKHAARPQCTQHRVQWLQNVGNVDWVGSVWKMKNVLANPCQGMHVAAMM